MKTMRTYGSCGMARGITFLCAGIAGCSAKRVMLLGMLLSAYYLCSYAQIRRSMAQGDDGKCNNHDYVDLGLSVKWATCNVGTSSPSDYGDYFAWGEVLPKSEYTEGNSVIYGKTMSDISGNLQHDAARSNWGGSWRLPTWTEWKELRTQCRWTWMVMEGTAGYRITGKTGHSIFLPAAGWRSGMTLYGAGFRGYYWSSTPDEGTTVLAYYLYFDSSTCWVDWNSRFNGRSIRPVTE